MQIVIDIPEEVGISNIVNEIDCLLTDYFNGTYCKIIPLPKGHGRLIDESKIKKCGWNFIDYHAKTDAPTIIEADKGEEV